VEGLFTLENLVALITLTSLEVVLGIDNVVFVAILTGRLDPAQQPKARRIGMGLAMIMRIALLLAISWVMGLTRDLFSLMGHGVSGRDMILLIGGGFLIAKSTYEIHGKFEAHDEHAPKQVASFKSAIIQIVLIDIVFSLDSVITAVGMAKEVTVMIAAIIIAVGVMLIFANRVSAFIERHPTVKMLALSFLLLIGTMLVLDGAGQHVNKGYIYFAMAFSFVVEMLNIRLRKPHPAH
jgi:predicted tellurium resistance membrane protein TerC